MADQKQDLGSAVLTLSTEDSEYTKDIDRAGQLAEQLGVKFNVAGKAVAVAAVTAAVAIAELVSHQIESADQFYKQAQAAGLTTSELSSYAYAAKLSDINSQGLVSAIGHLAKNMQDSLTTNTSEAGLAFEALNIKVADNSRHLKNADVIMEQVAERFAGMEDGAGKSALAMAVFGRSGKELIPLLNQGAAGLREAHEEAQQFGVVIDTQTAKAAEHFNDNLTKMSQAATGVGNSLMRDALPGLNAFTDKLVEITKHQEVVVMLAKIAALPFAAGAIAANLLTGSIEKLTKGVGDLYQQFPDLPLAIDEKVKAPILKNREEIKKALDAQIADLNFFGKQVGQELGAQNQIDQERFDQKLITQDELIRRTAANEDIRLQVLANAQKREAELYKAAGETAKAREAERAAQLLEAERVSNQAITDARLSSLNARYEQERTAAQYQFELDMATKVQQLQTEALTEQEQRQLALEQKQADLATAVALGQITQQQANLIMENIELQHQAKLGNLAAQGALARKKFDQMTLAQQSSTLFGELANITSGVAQHNKTLFEINKAAGIANALINAYTGISLTLSTYPFPINIAMAAAHALVAFAQIQAIRGQSFDSGGGAAAPSLAGSTPATPVTAVPAASNGTTGVQQSQPNVTILVNGKLSRDALEELADGLNDLHGDGFPLFKVKETATA